MRSKQIKAQLAGQQAELGVKCTRRTSWHQPVNPKSFAPLACEGCSTSALLSHKHCSGPLPALGLARPVLPPSFALIAQLSHRFSSPVPKTSAEEIARGQCSLKERRATDSLGRTLCAGGSASACLPSRFRTDGTRERYNSTASRGPAMKVLRGYELRSGERRKGTTRGGKRRGAPRSRAQAGNGRPRTSWYTWSRNRFLGALCSFHARARRSIRPQATTARATLRRDVGLAGGEDWRGSDSCVRIESILDDGE